jgi:hypothetical protein
MSLENHMVVGPDDFDEVVKCSHLGEMTVDEFHTEHWLFARIRCVDCGVVFEGHVSEVKE